MKKILNVTKLATLLGLVVFFYQSGYACPNRGNIVVSANDRCDIGRLVLKLTNHTTTTGTQYFWQMSNDGGLSWGTMAANSQRDTQLIPPIAGRMYRCLSVCPTSNAYSDTISVNIQNRTITVDQIFCSTSAGGNDSILLKAAPASAATDGAFARYYKWQVSSTNGVLWDDIGTSSSTVKVKFTPNILQYRAFVTSCPLTGLPSTYPTAAPYLVSTVDIGLNGIGLIVSNKDCVNDTARLSLTNILPSLSNFLKYNWYESTTGIMPYSAMGKTDSFLKVKVNNVNKYYASSVKLCTAPFPSKDSLYTNTYDLIVKLGNFSANLNCATEMVEIDYTNRNLNRKSIYTYWTRSQNDSTNHSLYTVPEDSVKHSYPLTNGINYFYKVYSKFCSTSTAILDSSYNVNVKFKIDTGQLKATIQTCTNDSVYLKLLNYKDSSSFSLVKRWMIKRNGNNFFENYTQTPMTDTTITFRMDNGWNAYRKSISLCADKYAKTWSSTEAKTFLPYQASYAAACTGNMTVNVLNDTVKIVDYTGTVNRSNATFAYQWLRSTNKVTSTIVAGANNPSLVISQADKNAFFKRLTRICSANTFSDTTTWSNISTSAPVSSNGQAQVTSTVCLNDSVQICVINGFTRGTDTPTFVWQYSPNDINWVNMNSNTSNDSCTKAFVTTTFQYFRRLTFWCPSGIVDSSNSVPLIYVPSLPWTESFSAQVQFGENIFLPCWRGVSPVCSVYSPTYTGGKIWSRASGGKSDKFMSNWGPAPVDPKAPPGRRNDMKLMTPAFDLKRGKVYRFSFWHKEDASNICWDSLYVTWGQSPDPCSVTNKFGEKLTRFSFDQYNRFWSDFTPTDDGIYYFAVNLREGTPTTGEVGFDEFNVKEVESCEGKSPVKGTCFAPSKIIDRSEDPSKAPNYDKDKVTHQYCVHDTIMLTYQEMNYANNFDYHGMTYQFWKKRSDKDWKIEDTFFKPVVGDTLCHITNRSDYHVMNVLVTDTHTWYKIVATCQYNGKEYHSDSLLVNGTHSLPYCEDWEGPGRMQNQPPATNMGPPKQGNSGKITGKVPSFSNCPTCWGCFPQVSPTMPSPNDQNLFTVTLPFLNLISGVPQIPQAEPDNGWNGNNVVMNHDGTGNPITTRKVLVMPAMRLYKDRGYRVSFRWSDNRRIYQSPWGNVNQDLDSLYLVVTKGNQSGKVIDSFPKSKMVPNSLFKDLKSNILEAGSAKYRTFWVDYSPSDTGTYYFGIVVVAGAANGNPYRFYMDYFCVDTMPMDDCNEQPEFKDPLRVRVSPDGKTWSPGDTIILPPGVQWCVGSDINLELDFGFGPNPAWKYGWKMYWQRTTQDPNIFPNPVWTTIDSTNGISYRLSNKFQDFRLILANKCKTKFDTIGRFKVLPYAGTPSCGVGLRETFLNPQFSYSAVLPQCWDVYPPCRVKVLDDMGVGNEFHQKSKLHKNYIDMDFINTSDPSCPMRTYCTAVPPGYGVTGGTTYRFSFWYKDNGISVPVDSITAGYSFSRPTDMYQFRLVNKVNNDVVKNSKSNQWRYYTTEVTPTVDTAIHFKVITYNIGGKRIYRTMFDDFDFKPKQNVDALVIAIDSPSVKCGLTANEGVKVTIMNIGNQSLTDVPIKVRVGGPAGTPVSYTASGTLLPNETRTVVVPGVDLSANGNLEISAWTDVLGEQYKCDDTFTTEILHNELPLAPTDTIDSVCICNSHTMESPYSNSRWYRNATDLTPLKLGRTYTMDSVCSDTSIYYSTWNGAVDYTYPPNFSYGAPTYSGAAGGLHFDNLSKDTIMIDSVMVYANTLSTTGFNITLTQFIGAQQVTINSTATTIGNNALNITKLGRQWLPIKFKIPPGTDYKLRYPGGAALAQLPSFIYIGSGSPTCDLNILGDDAYPNAPTAYKYFFNWRLVKVGCESERVKKILKVVPTPTFQLKDTARVCSRPIYQLCGPSAPFGQTYKYLWSAGDTTMCKGVTQTGWYQLSVTNDFGCQEKDSTNIIVDPSPIFTLGPDTSFCRYSPYTIKTGLDSINNVVTWSDNQAGVNITILNPDTYVATAYNTANFCTAKDTIVVSRRELPVFSLGNDRVFCGTQANLAALAPNLPTNLTYSWHPSPAPVVITSGKYWVEGTDVFGCKNTDTIQATLIANPTLNLGPNDTAVCGNTFLVGGPSGNYYYNWSTTATSQSISIAQPGIYYLTITDKTYGCQAVDSIRVTFKQVPVFDLGADVVKCGASHTIQGPTGLSNYFWKKPNSSTYTAGGATFSADESGVYYLRVDNNCYNYTDSIRITLKTTPSAALDKLRDTFGCRQALLTATDSNINTYISIQWGSPLNSSANTVLVDKSGTYSVSLTNECGYATKAVQVRIDQTPTADFTVAYPDPTPNCMSIILTNLSTNGVTYLWSFGDNKTSSTENPLHEYVQEGNYLVTLKTYNSCGFASKTLPIKRRDKSCSILSINGLSLESSQIYVFPNPAKDNTQLLGIGLPNGVYKLSVKNLLGQSIFDKEVKITNTEIDVKLDIANFANGEYLVELSGDNETIVRKLQVIK